MGCMEQYNDEDNICPFCGYSEHTKKASLLHIDPGEVIQGRYIIGRSIGFGGFGITYIAWDALLQHKVAIKEYMPSEFSTRSIGTKEVTVLGGQKSEQFSSGMKKFGDEAKKLAKFNNNDDGIVRVYDSFEENNTAYIVMELLKGRTLADYLKENKTVPYEEAVRIIVSIAESLKSVHKVGIIHRDIAPDNVFLTNDNKVKLIDFGAARFATTSHSQSLSVLIKQGYSPEEQYRSRGNNGSYTDIYSLGAVMYTMFTGEVPPDALERRAFLEKNKKDILNPISKYIKGIPENIQNAVYNAMNVNIEDRTQTAEDFISELTTKETVKRRQPHIRSSVLWLKIIVSGFIVLSVVFSVLFATGIIGFGKSDNESIQIPEGMARVPSLISCDLESARERLNEEFLIGNISGKEYSDLIPADFILNQSIDSGTVVAQNTVVGLVISGGTETATVPDVVGMYIDNAIEKLREQGFLYLIEYKYSDEIAESGVISQNIKDETEYEVGGEVLLTVSKGRNPDKQYEDTMVKVPDFEGKTYEEAVKLAQKNHLMIIAKEKKYSNGFDKDTVMKQSISAGSEIMSGNTIELTVSLGVCIIKVPDLKFKTEAEAKNQLEKLGLKTSVKYETTGNVKAGLVISQTPEIGTTASSGDTINLIISKGDIAFEMPDVTDMSESEAKKLLLEKGLSVNIEYEYSNDYIGKVIKQDIAVGKSVYSGNSVTITIGTEELLITVPDVSNISESKAFETLKSQGFRVGNSNLNYSDTVPAGNVINQTPPAGSSQKKGTSIVLTISMGKELVNVPDVKNESESVAESDIAGKGLNPIIIHEYSDTIASGIVINQFPASGESAERGSDVTITVSKGKKVTETKEIKSTEPETIKSSEQEATNLIEPESVSISTANIGIKNPDELYVSESYHLEASVSPSNADDNIITWSSSDSSVISVDSDGNIRAVSAGNATITATTIKGNKKSSVNFTVYEPEMYLHSSYVELNPLQTYNIDYFTNGNSDDIQFYVSDDTLLGYSRNGSDNITITPYRVGETDITASYVIGETTLTSVCHVVVHKEPYATIDETSVTLTSGDRKTLSCSYGGSAVISYTSDNYNGSYNSDNFSVFFRSSNENVVIVDNNGTLTAVGEGSATVTYTVNGASDTCTVTVIRKEEILSGNGGSDITWKLENGTLTISGAGNMKTYSSGDYPWKSHADEITEVIIEENVETIADYAFDSCSNISSVTLPDTLTEIGTSAFAGCSKLKSVEIPYSVEIVKQSAFDCQNLESITFYNSECEIYDSNYTICNGAGIYGYYESTAQEYAGKYNMSFNILSRYPEQNN